MISSPSSFVVDSERRGLEVIDSLPGRFRARREVRPAQRETYLDTFDWRLYRKGKTLTSTPHGDATLLSLGSIEGATLQRLQIDKAPAFARDLPPGSLREELSGVVEMRRLLPVADLQTQAIVLRIVDARDKTVARVELETGRAGPPGEGAAAAVMPPRLLVVPVTGYPDAHTVAGHLEQGLGLPRERGGRIDSALHAIGRKPCDYSSKLRVSLDPRMPSERAARRVLRALLKTMLANESGTRDDLDSEFLHDFRVSVRRTRSCLGQVKDVFSDDRVERFRGEFSWLGGLTGPTRDLDVFLLKMPAYRAALPPSSRAHLEQLRRHTARRQREEQRKLSAGLVSPRYGALVRDWEEFLGLPGDPEPSNAERPILDLASDCIARRYRRVAKKGRALDAESSAKRFHRMRIECKKLRYLLEFFRSLYEPRDLEPAVKILKQLQDNLGDLNDLMVQQESLRRFAEEMIAEGEVPAATLIAMGRLVERIEEQQRRERAAFVPLFSAFAGTEVARRMRRMLGRPEEASR